MIDIKTKLTITASIFCAAILAYSTSTFASFSPNKIAIHNSLLQEQNPAITNDNSIKIAAICDLGTGNCNHTFGYDESNNNTNSHQCRPGYVYINKQGCVRNACPPNFQPTACSGASNIQTGTATTPSGKICYGCRISACSSYTLSSCPTNGICSNCPDDSSQKKLDTCNSNYKVSANTCILKTCPSDFGCLGSESCVSGTCKNDTCPSGYQKSSSCDNGISGTVNTNAGTSCYQCKGCPNNCNLSSCPIGATCDYETCSGKFCAIGCEIGKISLDNFWCGGALRCLLK